MKYWDERKSGKGELRETSISLKDEIRVINIFKQEDTVVFAEGCDDWFSATYAKEHAIEVLQEAIEWLSES